MHYIYIYISLSLFLSLSLIFILFQKLNKLTFFHLKFEFGRVLVEHVFEVEDKLVVSWFFVQAPGILVFPEVDI